MENQELKTILNKTNKDEFLYISQQGLQKLTEIYDKTNPQKHIQWETDYGIELPIRIKNQGEGSEPAFTLIDAFHRTLKTKAGQEALRVKLNGVWQVHTYQQFYNECTYFANGCISLGLNEMKSVNIMGFNSPEWIIAFYGSIFGHYLPVGVYTTNGPDACQYVSNHSDAEMVIVENQDILNRYIQVWKDLPQLKYIVVYRPTNKPLFVPDEYKQKVLLWNDFLQIGKNFKPSKLEDQLEERMQAQKPGNCCTLVYTSGTTGQPKAVMLSHDNYTWTCQQTLETYDLAYGKINQERIVSYLPLSHVAAQITDIISLVLNGGTTWFAEPSALQGTLITTLQECRPTFFLGVPRVWEKIEEKMKFIASTNGLLKKQISEWAKKQGKEGSFTEINKKNPTFCFNLAKKVVYNNVKKGLGLDQARILATGAAPLQTTTRDYFLSLNMVILNCYGMSESSGPQTMTDPKRYDDLGTIFLKSAGNKLSGTEMMIYNPDKEGNGEICYRGRNRFMGYYKNDKATQETIDQDGFLHSGDVGKVDKNGNLDITGRIKELIITAGGENIAPFLIENQIKSSISFLSQVILVGEQRKYLIALLTLRMEADNKGLATDQISKEIQLMLEREGFGKIQKVQDLKNNDKFNKFIQQGIDQANSKAISKAHHVRKWYILDQDFTTEGGELTPTMKLKRSVTIKKYNQIIEKLYLDSNL